MDKIQILDKKFKLFIPYEKLDAAIDRVASELNNDFKECDDVPVMLCVLNGSIMFMSELMNHATTFRISKVCRTGITAMERGL